MANSECVGVMECPICCNDQATVHKQRTGTKKGRLYYRCYTEPMGVTMRCGTIQCIGPDGQEAIKQRMRPIDQQRQEKEPIQEVESDDFVPGEPIAQQEQEERREPVEGSSGGFLEFIFGDDE